MKRIKNAIALIVLVITITSCGKKNSDNNGPYPANFASLGDTGRVAYVMKNAEPDSVARFIIRGALGELPGARIDSLGIVTNYVYSAYDPEKQVIFGEEYDRFIGALPLAKQMKIYSIAGEADAQGLGYELGLNYMSQIRDRNMTAEEVSRDIEEFRKACGSDTVTYKRFMIGFKTVLQNDKDIDVNSEIYRKYCK